MFTRAEVGMFVNLSRCEITSQCLNKLLRFFYTSGAYSFDTQ